jgi:hypothetical protein
MYLKEIWRYPVKSMAGQRLDATSLSVNGVEGDRLIQAFDIQTGRMLTARQFPGLLGLSARLEGTEIIVDGEAWDSEHVAAAVDRAVGRPARLVRHEGPERFDILPLLVATDGSLAAFGEDHRRLRPNLVIGDVAGLAEREWEGRNLRVGKAIVGVHSLRDRCIMTTFHPDTLEQDVNVLRRIRQEFDGKLALNCWVIEPGPVAVGDPVELEWPSTSAAMARRSAWS